MPDKSAIQEDWETREFVETLTLGIQKITEFVNHFDMHTRYQLAKVDDKLNLLEKKMSFLEAQIKTVS